MKKAVIDLKYQLRTKVLGYVREAQQNIRSSIHPKFQPTKKFLIFGVGRNGSTLLVSLLNSHPNLYCDGEILSGRVADPMRMIENRSQMFEAEIYGFKLLSYQLWQVQTNIEDKQQFLQELIEKGYKIIHLKRLNKLQLTLSVIYALYRDKWHNAKNKQQRSNAPLKIHLEVAELEQKLKEVEGLYKFEKNVLEGIPHLSLLYEKDLELGTQHEITMEKICHFLDIPPVEPSTNLRKVTPKQLSSFLINATEIETYLQQSEYAKMVV